MMHLLRLYFFLFRRWVYWLWHARTIYDLHAPAAYRFAEAILEDKREFYAFSKIETLRSLLREDKRNLEIQDYGAGSLVNKNLERTIANIAGNTPIPPAIGRMLFRIVHLYQPDTIIELGSSLGISTAYMATARARSKIFTIEGSLEIYNQALRNWKWLNTHNILPVNGIFREALPELLSKIDRLDLLFLDGDHREEATLYYVERCLEKAHDQSVFIIADIHWSAEMEKAWNQIKSLNVVRLSIDLFHIGVLFFDPKIKVKQDYCLAPSLWKPWRMGFW